MATKPNYHHALQGENRELQAVNIPVEGRLPEWLNGRLLRNGPGSTRFGVQEVKHWFDGQAMLHQFDIHNGQVDYACRFLENKARQAAEASGQISYPEFATDPCRSLFKKVMTLFGRSSSDNAKVNITRFAGAYIALAETPIQVEFDPDTLRSAGVFTYEPNPVGQMTTAHPHQDADHLYNVVTRFNRVSEYRFYRMGLTRQTQMVGAIKTGQPSYMHSFGLSPRYAIITEFPFVVNPLNLLLWLRPFIENYQWKPRRPTVFWLIDRETGAVAGRYESDPFFAFHHVNAFERDGEAMVDVVGYDDASIVSHYYFNRLNDVGVQLPHGTLRRYRVQLGKKRLTWERLADTCIELPRTDYDRYNLRGDYRSVYGIGLRGDQPTGFYNQLVKLDAQGGPSLTWSADGCFPGEPVFAARPGGSTDDDGALLSVVLDTVAGGSFLLVLDARTLAEVARATLPQAVMFGFHGHFARED
jgi:carotenoid cleavage dioxygenase-like enzyme